MAEEVWLFSYGTLRQREVQQALFGRELESVEDELLGYELGYVTITDPDVVRTSGSDRHPILRAREQAKGVIGAALRLEAHELEAADRYEADDYARVPVTLRSGRAAYAYVHRQEASL